MANNDAIGRPSAVMRQWRHAPAQIRSRHAQSLNQATTKPLLTKRCCCCSCHRNNSSHADAIRWDFVRSLNC